MSHRHNIQHDLNIPYMTLKWDTGVLTPNERRWAGYYNFLLQKGYQLRPRYRPGWVPSWKATRKDPGICEDGWPCEEPSRSLDAMRIRDQKVVRIRILQPSVRPKDQRELEIMQRIASQDPAGTHRANHNIPTLDIFNVPDIPGGVFYVTPLLIRYDRPHLRTQDEVYDFIRQAFEGLMFLHERGVAHGNIASPNFLMDGRPLYREPHHPLHSSFSYDGKRILEPRTRTEAPVKYYYTGFGYSSYKNRDGSFNLGAGRQAYEAAPEQLTGEYYNPFAADVYQLGALIRREIVPKINIPALKDVTRAMTNMEPKDRISLAQARQAIKKCFGHA